MKILATKEVVRHHMPETDFWVDLKSELTGYEEQKRQSLFEAVQLSMTTKDAELARRGEVENTSVAFSAADLSVRLAEFDMEHYIVEWSEPIATDVQTYRKLDKGVYKWLLETIEAHREGVQPLPGDLTIGDEPGNSQGSSDTPSGE